MWSNLGRVFAESWMFDRIVRSNRIDDRSGSILTSLQASGKGTVFVCLHSGNWELAIVPVIASGLKAASVYQRVKNPLVDAWVLAGRRERFPRGLFPKGADVGRRLMRVVREGGAVAILADLRDRRGVSVPFFGRPAPSTIFPALLSRTSSDATLIAARIVRTKGVHFVFELVPIAVSQTEDRDADIVEATAAIQATFEKWIREHPEQWMWSHRRWG
jgi:KDO2-lipid IV(A) lauroyltransferase